MNRKKPYLLAIESAIAGGSIAILDNHDLISSRCGDGSVSRAEDLLPNIISMLDEAGISKHDLSRVAVSLGPGSYTGLRIGIATVMGLKRGLGIEYVGVPLFDALAAGVSDAGIAVPMGKADICFAASDSPGSPRVVSLDNFVEYVRTDNPRKVLAHPALADILTGKVPNVETLDPNLAVYIGRYALGLPPSDSLEPIYIQNPRFGQ